MNREIERLLPPLQLRTSELNSHLHLLTCGVCEESFEASGQRVPRLLACGHSLCHSCLSRLVTEPVVDTDSAGIICPFDRQPTPVGLGGIAFLKKNFSLVELIEKLSPAQLDGLLARSCSYAHSCSEASNSSGTCGSLESIPTRIGAGGAITQQHGSPGICRNLFDPRSQATASQLDLNGGLGEIKLDLEREQQFGIPCEENDFHIAVMYCVVCASHLCAPCSLRTHRTRVLAKHRRVPISQKPQAKLKCPYHSAYAIEFVCLEEDCAADSPLMCLLCRDYGRHVKHRHGLLDTEAASFRRCLTLTMESIASFQSELAELLGRISRTIGELQGHDVQQGSADAARHQIQHHFARLREQLATQEAAAVAVVDTFVRERTGGLRVKQEDLTLMLSQVSAVGQQLEKSAAQDDNKLMSGRQETQLLMDAVGKQRLQFGEIPGQLNLEPLIPISFTKDNRVHIGPKIEMRVVTLGLDSSGKTTILFKLKLNEVIPTMPTIGFNVETLEYKNLRLTIWDVGGVPKLRPLWKHYYSNTQALIFVIDSCDHERLMEVQGELVKLLSERELRDASLLVLANKQDLSGSISVDTLVDQLALSKLCYGRSWHVQGCNALTGAGLWDGIDWLSRQLVSSATWDDVRHHTSSPAASSASSVEDVLTSPHVRSGAQQQRLVQIVDDTAANSAGDEPGGWSIVDRSSSGTVGAGRDEARHDL